MYECITRAVRQTIALQVKIDTEARMTADQRAAAYLRRAAAEDRSAMRQADQLSARLRGEVARIGAEMDQAGFGDGTGVGERKDADGRKVRSDRENLLADLRERLEDPPIDDGRSGWTYGEILRAILDDVDVNADLSVFTPEQLARVYTPATWRRPGAVPQAAAPVGDVDDPGGATAPPPPVANGHDPPA